MPVPDLTNKFNTPLPADKRADYQAWLKTLPPGQRSTFDYDLQGAFLAGQSDGANGHLTDRFKKPNHPTFSTESKYSGVGGQVGGVWKKQDGHWIFKASPTNLRYYPPDQLRSYFQRVEPGNKLILPSNALTNQPGSN